MILDINGDPIPEKKRHKFGEFEIPKDARLVMGDGFYIEDEYPYVPSNLGWFKKEDFRHRCSS